MKKLLFAASLLLTIGGCKKEDDRISQEVEVSYPTITFSGSQFYSITPGGSVPSITATAYDSVLNESYDVEITGTDAVNINTPGLYIITATAKNRYGFESQNSAYIAVTNISDAVNLEGEYVRVENGEPVNVMRMARGLYGIDDVGGAATLEVTAYFVHLQDSLFDVPLQPTSAGELECVDERLRLQPGDTVFSYSIINPSFGTARRNFEKQ